LLKDFFLDSVDTGLKGRKRQRQRRGALTTRGQKDNGTVVSQVARKGVTMKQSSLRSKSEQPREESNDKVEVSPTHNLAGNQPSPARTRRRLLWQKRAEPLGARMRRHAGQQPGGEASLQRLHSLGARSPQAPGGLHSAGVVNPSSSSDAGFPSDRSNTFSKTSAAGGAQRQSEKSPRASRDTIDAPIAALAQASHEGRERRPATPPEHQHREKPSREEIWTGVFRKLLDDGEVHRDSLQLALTFIGFVAPDQCWIDQVYSAITNYSSLSLEDFMKFVSAYEVRQHQAYAEAFVEYDEDGSGSVEVGELATLLRTFGIQPMRHVLEEVIEEVDEDGAGSVELGEFETLMEIIKEREGFTKSQHSMIMGVYTRFDRDCSGEIDTKELIAILTWLGYVVDPDRMGSIVKEVDIDGSGSINEREYLMCIRKVRDQEIEKVINIMQTCDTDGNGTLDTSEVELVLQELGYIPIDDAVIEAIQEAGFQPGDQLDLSQFWQLLAVYRSREGFGALEAAEIEEAFHRYDTQQDGEVSSLEVGRLLRSLGYCLSVEELGGFIARVDVDGSGELDLGELRKLVRMFREQELLHARDVFEHWAFLSGTLTRVQAIRALSQMGISQPAGATATVLEEDLNCRPHSREGPRKKAAGREEERMIDLRGFLRVFVRERRRERQKFKDQCGFSTHEMEELRELFDFYDKDGGGDIKAKEQIKLIEDFFPEMAHDKETRPKLLAIMDEVDSDRSGSLNFYDFLRLMQQLRELQDQAKVAKEMEAIKLTGFSVQEVQDFRELFLRGDDGSGELSLAEVKSMINKVTPLGDKYLAELTHIFRQYAGQGRAVEGEPDMADFPEFLFIMRRVLEVNFARIKERTTRA